MIPFQLVFNRSDLIFEGVGMAKRAMARAATPVVTYSLNGDEITIVTTSMKDYTSKYTIGVECDEETLDGRKTKVFIFCRNCCVLMTSSLTSLFWNFPVSFPSSRRQTSQEGIVGRQNRHFDLRTRQQWTRCCK